MHTVFIGNHFLLQLAVIFFFLLKSDVTFKFILSEKYVCSFMKDWLSAKRVFNV